MFLSGGIYSLPPYLSPDARHILQKMLIVDSTKRIKLSEIRKHPWFQKDLPTYLEISDVEEEESDGEAPVVSESTDKLSLSEDTSKVAWINGVGLVEQSVVDDLCSKIPSLTSDDVWSTLEGAPSRENRELIIAYKLCRDNRQSSSMSISIFQLAKPNLAKSIVFSYSRIRASPNKSFNEYSSTYCA